MRLIISKAKLLGASYALIISALLTFTISTYFFGLVINYEGSDYSQNLYNISAASEGYFGGTSDNVLMYLVFDGHFYFWLGKLSSLTTNNTLILQGLTASAVLALTGPSIFSAGQKKNRILLLALLVAIFLHPRFIDLVTGNIRSAVALSIAFCALRVQNTKFKYILLSLAPTFHLGVIVLLVLYSAYRFWELMPKLLCRPDIKVFTVFLFAGILCFAAQELFPERGGGEWEGRAAYTTAILGISCYVFFLGKYFVNNVFGFVALGLISLVVWGAILDYATMRYFSFFFPFFGAAVMHFHRQPQVLIMSLSVMAAFTLASQWYYLL